MVNKLKDYHNIRLQTAIMNLLATVRISVLCHTSNFHFKNTKRTHFCTKSTDLQKPKM